MSAKQITFQLLDELEDKEFKGAWLWMRVVKRENIQHYPDTILRYMREWRKVRQGVDIILVDKRRSIYKKITEV